MKKITLCLSLFFMGALAQAQNGLENVIVETYYISDANDSLANLDGGVLPVGSVTYRIYADMLPGYKFQAGYGVPGHECRIETSTLFFNNEDRGNTTPTYTKTQAKLNTVMLDSWLSVGAGCAGNFGILKSEDDGVATVVNNYTPMVLQNNNALAGIPLTLQDGLILSGTVPEPVTQVGISTEIEVFNNQNDGTNGPVFATSNGSWASLNGSVGPDPNTNKVLIAQITTDGLFSFELNIQIGTPTGGVQNYVADSAVANEIQAPFMTYPNTASIGSTIVSNQKSLFLVFPNPAKNLLTIKVIPAKGSVNNNYTIFNSEGKAVYNKQLGTGADKFLEQVDLSSFANGLYVVQFSSDGVISSQKVVKN